MLTLLFWLQKEENEQLQKEVAVCAAFLTRVGCDERPDAPTSAVAALDRFWLRNTQLSEA